LRNRKVRIAGIGNALAGDDAVGQYAVEQIRRQQWAGVECVSESVPGPELFEELGGNDLLIVIDACRTGAADAGSILLFSPEEFKDSGVGLCSSHGLGLIDWIQLTDQAGEAQPEMMIFGVEAKQCDMGEGLSESVAQAVPALVECIRSRINPSCINAHNFDSPL